MSYNDVDFHIGVQYIQIIIWNKCYARISTMKFVKVQALDNCCFYYRCKIYKHLVIIGSS